MEVGRHGEQGNLAQRGRPIGFQHRQPGMVAVAEAHALSVLKKFDTIEDAAAHIARALERIGAVARQQHCRLIWRQPGAQALVAFLAKQAASDSRHADRRDIQIDEARGRITGLRRLGGERVARLAESLRYLADAETQRAHRAIADQIFPAPDRHLSGIEPPLGLRDACGDARPAQSPRADEPDGGAHHAIAHHQHGDGGAAHDVHLGRAFRAGGHAGHILADDRVERGQHLGLGNADQHYGLVMVDKLQPMHLARGIDADHDADRLAGIADGTGEIGIEKGVAK